MIINTPINYTQEYLNIRENVIQDYFGGLVYLHKLSQIQQFVDIKFSSIYGAELLKEIAPRIDFIQGCIVEKAAEFYLYV